MMSIYENLIGQISNAMYSYILIILLVGGGIFFTLRTKGVQKYLIEAFRVILQPAEDQDKESISAFQSMMISTASRVGTGNIAGVSFAICTGGPGAVFWMWVIAFFGMATAFVEGTLAQIYKRRGENGSCYGGPSYYIESALKKRSLGIIYAIFMVLTYMVGFNLVASFNVADSFKAYSFYNAETTPLIVGIILAAVFGLCIMGGGKKIADVASFLVPIMGGLYIGAAVLIIALNFKLLPGVFASFFALAKMDTNTPGNSLKFRAMISTAAPMYRPPMMGTRKEATSAIFLPPPTPLLGGTPTQTANSPEPSYIPQASIMFLTTFTVCTLNNRRPFSGLTPSLASTRARPAMLSAVTLMEHILT